MKTPLRVLFVEDSEDDVHLLLRELRQGNYEVTWSRVETPEDMRAELARQDWDVIVSDYAMPRFDGRAALNLLKQKELDIPFIIISGTVGEDTVVEVMKSGAHDYVMKDNLTRLVPAIKRELKEAETRKMARQAEEARRISEQRLQLALVGANDGIWDWNIRTGEVYYSPRWAEMLGFEAGEIEPRKEAWMRLIHPKDREAVQNAIDAHFSGLTPVFEVEYRLRTKAGQWKWILTRGKAVERDANGSALRAAGTNVDLTERKMLEEQLRHAQKMESIGLLAGGIAHDFNNLLTVILGHVSMELGMARTAAEPNASLIDSLEQIGFAAERAAALTRQLLAFSKRQVLKLEIIEPAKILTNFEPMLRRLIGEHIRLKLEIEPGLGSIRADAALVEQIIMNLVVNARDAMPEGGVLTLHLACVTIGETDRLRQYGAPCGSNVVLSVSDTGVGMDEETRRRIFEPFFTTKPTGKGTGLGLATVYGIVKQLDGYIDVESEKGKGTTMRVFFPTVETPAHAEEKEKGEQVMGGDETILLCEDEEIVRRVNELILKRGGYTVLVAADGTEALKIAKQGKKKFDLLITDLVMPDISGPQLAKTMLKNRPALPVLFMSGYTADAVNELNTTFDEVEFLNKPFRPNELLTRVRKLLDKSKTVQD
ncbi:MAG: response regulator [Calditrichaeota bacterium]|nr:MAG: response regulator [Calditrichota bacterium]